MNQKYIPNLVGILEMAEGKKGIIGQLYHLTTASGQPWAFEVMPILNGKLRHTGNGCAQEELNKSVHLKFEPNIRDMLYRKLGIFNSVTGDQPNPYDMLFYLVNGFFPSAGSQPSAEYDVRSIALTEAREIDAVKQYLLTGVLSQPAILHKYLNNSVFQQIAEHFADGFLENYAAYPS